MALAVAGVVRWIALTCLRAAAKVRQLQVEA
jgi:hypothetical protein